MGSITLSRRIEMERKIHNNFGANIDLGKCVENYK